MLSGLPRVRLQRGMRIREADTPQWRPGVGRAMPVQRRCSRRRATSVQDYRELSQFAYAASTAQPSNLASTCTILIRHNKANTNILARKKLNAGKAEEIHRATTLSAHQSGTKAMSMLR